MQHAAFNQLISTGLIALIYGQNTHSHRITIHTARRLPVHEAASHIRTTRSAPRTGLCKLEDGKPAD